MSSTTPSLNITPSKASFFLTLVGVITIGWQVASYFKAQETKNLEQDMRIERLIVDTNKAQTSFEKLAQKTDDLKEAVIRLTTVIENSHQERKTELLNMPTSKSANNLSVSRSK